jgi:hypothetical protein
MLRRRRYTLPVMRLLRLLLLLHPFAAHGAADRLWVAGWRITEPLTTARTGAAVLEANGCVYALGGVDGRNFLRTVEFAPIRADGTLGTWHLTAPLTEERGFFATTAISTSQAATSVRTASACSRRWGAYRCALTAALARWNACPWR